MVAARRGRVPRGAARHACTVPRISTLLGKICDEISMITGCWGSSSSVVGTNTGSVTESLGASSRHSSAVRIRSFRITIDDRGRPYQIVAAMRQLGGAPLLHSMADMIARRSEERRVGKE